MKKSNIFLIIVTVIIIISFSFFALSIYAARSVFGCPLYLYDHEEIVKISEGEFDIQIPEASTNLCFAANCGIDYAYCYLSLTFSDKEECKQFIESLDISMADFQNVSELPEEFRWIPHIWYCGGYRTFEEKWGITDYNDYDIFSDNKTQMLKVVYVPNHCKIYIIKRVSVRKMSG